VRWRWREARGIRILSEPYASLGDASERDARKASEKESATPRIDRSIDRERQRRVGRGREGFLSAGTKRFACASAIFGAGFGAASDCIPRTRRLKSIFLARSGRKKTRGTMHHAVHALSPREATTARDLIQPALCIKAAHCTARVHCSFPGLRMANTGILRSAARAFQRDAPNTLHTTASTLSLCSVARGRRTGTSAQLSR